MLSRVARFNPGLVLCLVILGPLTYLIHQFGHWATGEALGVDMWLSVAKAGSVDSEFGSRLNRILVVMAGPVLTVLIASIAWWVAKRTGSMIAYGVLCFQFMMRLVAGSIALISGNLNDEAIVGIELGIGPYPVSVAVTAILFALTWMAARRVLPGRILTIALCAASGAIVLAIVHSDRFVPGLDQVRL